jgi:competence protein ComEA
VVILLSSFIYNKIRPEKKIVNIKKEIIYNDNSENKMKNGKVNINKGGVEDYLSIGINLTMAKKIVNYREIVGKVEKLEELSRISGIGKKTVEKLSKKIEVGDGGKLNKLKINKASKEEMKYYGFTSREIKKIEKFKEKNGIIFSNIEMIEILGEERYREYENRISY